LKTTSFIPSASISNVRFDGCGYSLNVTYTSVNKYWQRCSGGQTINIANLRSDSILNKQNDWKFAVMVIGTIAFVLMFIAIFIFQNTNTSLLFLLSVLTATHIYQTIFDKNKQ